MANEDLGTKRDCPECGARFYDLTKSPAVCPKCAHEFVPEAILKPRRTRKEEEEAEDKTENESEDETEDKDEGESEATYLSSLSTALGSKETKVGELCAGACKLVSSISGRTYRRPVSFAVASLAVKRKYRGTTVASDKLKAGAGTAQTVQPGQQHQQSAPEHSGQPGGINRQPHHQC